MTDCLIIAPSKANDIYQNLNEDLSAIEPPIWAALLTKALLTQGKEIELIDEATENSLNFKTTIENLKPKIVAIIVYGQQPSASTQTMHRSRQLCHEIKKHFPTQKIILIGGHPSSLPEQTLMEEPCDYVAKGEGLNTILGLLATNELNKIPGLYYKEETLDMVGILHGPNDTNATCLEKTFPGMAWDLLKMNKYRAHNWHVFGKMDTRGSYASIYTSLGCPFKCNFCCINAPFSKASFRYWEPTFVITELEKLASIGIKNLKIADEMFVLRENHFLKLCELIIERDFNFNIWAYARIDTIKEHYLAKLKKAGINWLALGIESANNYVRKIATKGHFQDTEIKECIRKVKDHGINIIGNYIFGLPQDTISTMQETYDLAVDLNCEMANFYSAMAYPGSALYNIAKEKKWALPESWLGYSQHSYETYPLGNDMLTPEGVLKFRDEAFKKYFSNRRYLNMIYEKFGKQTYEHVSRIPSYQLQRKFI